MSERLTAEVIASLPPEELWPRMQAESKRAWEAGESPVRVEQWPERGTMEVSTQITLAELQDCKSKADLDALIEDRVALCRFAWNRAARWQEPAKE